jgi:hypothetical protein
MNEQQYNLDIQIRNTLLYGDFQTAKSLISSSTTFQPIKMIQFLHILIQNKKHEAIEYIINKSFSESEGKIPDDYQDAFEEVMKIAIAREDRFTLALLSRKFYIDVPPETAEHIIKFFVDPSVEHLEHAYDFQGNLFLNYALLKAVQVQNFELVDAALNFDASAACVVEGQNPVIEAMNRESTEIVQLLISFLTEKERDQLLRYSRVYLPDSDYGDFLSYYFGIIDAREEAMEEYEETNEMDGVVEYLEDYFPSLSSASRQI